MNVVYWQPDVEPPAYAEPIHPEALNHTTLSLLAPYSQPYFTMFPPDLEFRCKVHSVKGCYDCRLKVRVGTHSGYYSHLNYFCNHCSYMTSDLYNSCHCVDKYATLAGPKESKP